MAYGSILGQNPTAQNTLYNNAQTSSIITANNVQGAIDQLFTSVSNGKQQIASAITDKGVSTSGTDSFATMAENIGKIATGEVKFIQGAKVPNSVSTSGVSIQLNADKTYILFLCGWNTRENESDIASGIIKERNFNWNLSNMDISVTISISQDYLFRISSPFGYVLYYSLYEI